MMENTNNSSGKKLILNSMIYSVSGLLTKCFSFFLLPLYTSFLSTEDYGITNLASTFLHTMGFVAALSIFSAVVRFYVDLKNDPEKLKRFYGTVILFASIMGLGWMCLLILFRGVISDLIFSGTNFFPVIFVSVITIVFYCLHNIYDNILKSQQKAAKASLLNIIYFFTTAGLNIVFVVVFEWRAFGVVLATFISLVLYTCYLVFDLMRAKMVTWCIDRTLLKAALKYSIPIIPHNLSTQITILVSQALIGGTASLSAVGVYAIAAQFGNIADIVQSYVNQAYGPWLYEKLHEKQVNYKYDIQKIIKVLTFGIVFFLLGIALFAEDYILLFLDESYSQACIYTPLVVLVYVIKIPYYFYINVLFYYKKAARMIFVATLSGSFVNLLLSAILIPTWSVYGSIVADALAMLIRVAIVIIISLRYENIGIKIRHFVLAAIVFTGFASLGLLPSLLSLAFEFNGLIFVYKVGIILLYVLMMGFIYRNNLKRIVLKIKNAN